MLGLQDEISAERNKEMIGKSVEVLVEGTSRTNESRLTGRTRQNQIVVFGLPEGHSQAGGSSSLLGKLANIDIVDSTDLTLFGVTNEF